MLHGYFLFESWHSTRPLGIRSLDVRLLSSVWTFFLLIDNGYRLRQLWICVRFSVCVHSSISINVIFIVHSDGLNAIQFFGESNVFGLAKLSLEFHANLRRNSVTCFAETFLLITALGQQVMRSHALVARQSHLKGQKSVQSRLVNGGNLVTFGTFCPSKVRSNCVNRRNKERDKAQSDRSFLLVAFKHRGAAHACKARDTGQDNHRQVNLRAPNRIQFFTSFVTPRQAGRLFGNIGKVDFQSTCPWNMLGNFFVGYLFILTFWTARTSSWIHNDPSCTLNIPHQNVSHNHNSHPKECATDSRVVLRGPLRRPKPIPRQRFGLMSSNSGVYYPTSSKRSRVLSKNWQDWMPLFFRISSNGLGKSRARHGCISQARDDWFQRLCERNRQDDDPDLHIQWQTFVR